MSFRKRVPGQGSCVVLPDKTQLFPVLSRHKDRGGGVPRSIVYHHKKHSSFPVSSASDNGPVTWNFPKPKDTDGRAGNGGILGLDEFGTATSLEARELASTQR